MSMDKLENMGYKKLSKEAAAKFDRALAMAPTVLENLNSKDTYRVVYDKTQGVLQKSKDKTGYRANIVSDNINKNNDIVGQATLKDTNAVVEELANVMAIASVVVGEYYMAEIDEKLSDIDTKLDCVKEFLEIDKKASMNACEERLKDIQRNIAYYSHDESRKTSSLTELVNIKLDSLKNCDFYKKYTTGLVGKLNSSDSVEKAKKKIEEIIRYLYGYWYSLFIYSYSCALEAGFSETAPERFFENIVEDIMNKCDEYVDVVSNIKNMLDKYIDTLECLEENKVLELMGLVKYVDSSEHKVLSKLSFISDMTKNLEQKDLDKKGKKESELLKKYSAMETLADISMMINKVNDVIRFNAINNRPVELLKVGDELYIKCDEGDKMRTLRHEDASF